MELTLFWQIFENYWSIKFHENPSSGGGAAKWGRTDGQADMMMLRVAFRNFANRANNGIITSKSHFLKFMNMFKAKWYVLQWSKCVQCECSTQIRDSEQGELIHNVDQTEESSPFGKTLLWPNCFICCLCSIENFDGKYRLYTWTLRCNNNINIDLTLGRYVATII